MDVSVRIVLVRHGETIANKTNITQGQAGGELTPLGRIQATLLGRRLVADRVAAGAPFVAAYVSDLARTRATWDLIAAAGSTELLGAHASSTGAAPGAHADGPPRGVVFTAAVRERAAGEFEGRPYGTADAAARAAGVSTRAFRPPGEGESWADVEARAKVFFEGLLAAHGQPLAAGVPAPAVLVVTHGGFMKELMTVIAPLRSRSGPSPGVSTAVLPGPAGLLRPYPNKAKNCCVYELDVRPAATAGDPAKWAVTVPVENDASHLDAAALKSASSGQLGGGKPNGAAQSGGSFRH